MNESYVPQPGEAVLVTLRMTAFEQHGLGFECDSTAGKVIMYASEPAVVSVERVPIPLPTLPHAVIRAEVGGRVSVLSLVDYGTEAPWYGLAGWLASEFIDRVVEVLFPGVTE